jgi:Divergent InlB B-repeat domain
VKGAKRVMTFALPVAVAAAALLCFAGGAYARSTADQALAVSVDGPGTITGNGIACRDGTGDCVELYADGTQVTLTATPDAGAVFTGWGGDCSAATGNTCTLTMSSAKAVTATFTSSTGPTLTVSVSGNGKITSNGIDCGNGSTDCSETFAAGTSVTLTEAPGTGATFTGWGGACTGTATTCTLTMNASQTVTGTFSGGSGGTQTLTVSVTGSGKVTGPGIDCGNGSTDCSEAYATGTAVTLTETPNSGATFTGWGGSCSGTATNCVVTMNAAKTVTATFTSSGQVSLVLSVSGSGRVTAPGINCGNGNTDCSEIYPVGTSVQLTAIPAAGATFAGWGGSCSGSATTCTVVMSAAKSVTAAFSGSSAQRILTVSVGGAGRVTGSGIGCGNGVRDCSQAYNNGVNVVLIATPAAGAVFLGWGGACRGTARTCTVTMTGPRAVSASFSTPGSRAGSTFAVRSLGSPIVRRTSAGWAVTLRFYTSRSSAALLRLSRNGRFVQAFTFSPRTGNVLVGPFHVGSPGRYQFRMTLSDGRRGTSGLIWNLCLGGCGSFVPAAVFIQPQRATAVRTASGWLVKVHFRAGSAGAATARMTVGGQLESSGSFTFRRGAVTVDLPARRAGLHQVVLTARNAAGRTFTVRWNILLR